MQNWMNDDLKDDSLISVHSSDSAVLSVTRTLTIAMKTGGGGGNSEVIG